MLKKNSTSKSSSKSNSSKKSMGSEDFNKKVAYKAYELFVKRGSTPGNEWGDWFEAEKIVRSGKA